jgi:hypothetical protein
MIKSWASQNKRQGRKRPCLFSPWLPRKGRKPLMNHNKTFLTKEDLISGTHIKFTHRSMLS